MESKTGGRCGSMQLREALQQAWKALVASNVPSPQLAAELLLMHVLRRDRSYLYAHPDSDLLPSLADRYFELIAERARGKPTQYITGRQEFWGLDFEVTPDVLIPRPETEHVVEAVLDFACPGAAVFDRRRATDSEIASLLRIVDVGTGSGCIALALAHEFARAEIYATDISALALAVAARNAARLDLPVRVKFVQGDLLAPLITAGLSGTFDFVVSNPPYVGRDEVPALQREVRDFEPRVAVGNLEHHDDIYRRLFPQALALLKPGGHVVVEIGFSMREQVVALLGEGWTEVEVRPDLAGIPRVVVGRKRP